MTKTPAEHLLANGLKLIPMGRLNYDGSDVMAVLRDRFGEVLLVRSDAGLVYTRGGWKKHKENWETPCPQRHQHSID